MAEFIFRGTVTTQHRESKAKIEQCLSNGKTLPIANIHRGDYVDDIRDTTISYASGTMHFYHILDVSRSYDPPPFWDNDHKELGYLRSFWRKTSDHIREYQYCLDFDQELFQIENIRMEVGDPSFIIVVYDSIPERSPKGLLYPVLATLTGTFCTEGSWEYRIKLTRAPSMEVLMAIFSLPFTT